MAQKPILTVSGRAATPVSGRNRHSRAAGGPAALAALDEDSGHRPRASRRHWPTEGPIGYIGGYVELIDSGTETEPAVASQLAPGPYRGAITTTAAG